MSTQNVRDIQAIMQRPGFTLAEAKETVMFVQRMGNNAAFKAALARRRKR